MVINKRSAGKMIKKLYLMLFFFMIFFGFILVLPVPVRAGAYNQLQDIAGQGGYVPAANPPAPEYNGNQQNSNTGNENNGNWANSQAAKRDNRINDYKQRRAARIEAARQRRLDAQANAQAEATATAYQQWKDNVNAEATKTAVKNNEWIVQDAKEKEEAAKKYNEAQAERAKQQIFAIKEYMERLKKRKQVIMEQLKYLTRATAANDREIESWEDTTAEASKDAKDQAFELLNSMLFEYTTDKYEKDIDKMKVEYDILNAKKNFPSDVDYTDGYEQIRERVKLKEALDNAEKFQKLHENLDKTHTVFETLAEVYDWKDFKPGWDKALMLSELMVDDLNKNPELALVKSLAKVDIEAIGDDLAVLDHCKALKQFNINKETHDRDVKALSIELHANMQEQDEIEKYVDNYKAGETPPYREKNRLSTPPPPLL